MEYEQFQQRYRDKQHIGAGGFGKVYKVFDHEKGHYVALKVADVRPEISKFTLKNEVELVNNLPHHKNIARYDSCYRFNTGFTGEMDFAILKYYEQGNLDKFLKNTEVTMADKDLLIKGVARGIEFLHKHHIIHRDLKAENVLIQREDGVWMPKVTDFGLSRMVNQADSIVNSAIGMSYAYAAPEQILNKKISSTVDIWAFGVIMYRVLAGELPFVGKSTSTNASAQLQLELSQQIVGMELPEGLNDIPEPYQTAIRRCWVLEPTERAQTATEILAILSGKSPEEAAAASPGSAPKPEPPAKPQVAEADTSAPTQIIGLGGEQSSPMDSIDINTRIIPPSAPTPPTPPASGFDHELPGGPPAPEPFLPAPEPEEDFEDDTGGETPTGQMPPSPQQGDGQKKSGKAMLVLSIAAVVVIGGGAAWFLLSGQGEPESPNRKAVVVAPALISFGDEYETGIRRGEPDKVTAVQQAADNVDYRQDYRPKLLWSLHLVLENDVRKSGTYLDAAHQAALAAGKADEFRADLGQMADDFQFFTKNRPDDWKKWMGGGE